MIELELTYLAKYLPDDLQKFPHKKIIDLYIDNGTNHPSLRIRKNSDKFELTRKTLVDEGDASRQNETTIVINEIEFNSFLAAKSRKIEKTRYYFENGDKVAEIDVFGGDLKGLVVIDFEFKREEDKSAFLMPEFCLADVTQETFIAGDVLAGKTYSDIESNLKRFNYKSLYATISPTIL